VLLVLLGLAVYVPGLLSLAPVDRDECRFAQASRQMLESVILPEAQRDPILHSGGLIVPMYGQQPRLNKPPLTYWLQASSAFILTGGDASADAMWMYRLPSALCAILSVLCVWRIGLGLFDARVALLGAAFLAMSPMVVWDAAQARSDQILLLCTCAAQLCLFRLWSAVPGHPHWQTWRIRWALPLLLWASLAAGVLAKGPIAPLVVGLTAGFLYFATRDRTALRRLRPLWGIAFLLLVGGLWALAIVSHVGAARAWQILNTEVLARAAVGSAEGHARPPGMHTVLSAVLLWPGSLLLAWGVWRGVKLGLPRRPHTTFPDSVTLWMTKYIFDRTKGRKAECYLIAWLLPGWIAFELIVSKLPHYTMPLYPAAALLAARAVFAAQAETRRALAKGKPSTVRGIGVAIWFVIGMVPLGGLALMILALGRAQDLATPGRVLAMGALCALSVAILASALRQLSAGSIVRAQWQSVFAAMFGLIGLTGLAAPVAAPGEATPRIMDAVGTIERFAERPLATAYREDSMVFASRGRIERIGDDAVLAWVDANPSGIIIAPVAMRDALFVRGFVSTAQVNVRPPLPPWLTGSPKEFIIAARVLSESSRRVSSIKLDGVQP